MSQGDYHSWAIAITESEDVRQRLVDSFPVNTAGCEVVQARLGTAGPPRNQNVKGK